MIGFRNVSGRWQKNWGEKMKLLGKSLTFSFTRFSAKEKGLLSDLGDISVSACDKPLRRMISSSESKDKSEVIEPCNFFSRRERERERFSEKK